MKQNSYAKGNCMTFPLKLAEIEKEEAVMESKYLYPAEVYEIQGVIEDACDRLEYDGSFMYDEYPDKVSVENMAKKICKETKCMYQEEISNRWMRALVQMMLCQEMNYRRGRRNTHKRNLGKYNN